MDKNVENILMFNNNLKEEKEYWMNRLSPNFKPSSFTFNSYIDGNIAFDGNDMEFNIPKEISDKIMSITNNSELGVYIVLLSSIKYLLYKLNDNEHIVTGMPILKSNKSTGSIPFDKVLPIIDQLQNTMTFKKLLNNVKDSVINGIKYRKIFIYKILEELNKTSITKSSILNNIVLLKNIHSEERISDKYLNDNLQTLFIFNIADSVINCKIKYNSSIISNQNIEKLIDYLLKFLSEVIKNPNIRLSDINLINDKEKNTLVQEFNNTYLDFPKNQRIHDLFKEQARKYPNKISVKYENKEITYRDLDIMSDKLAVFLRNDGIKENSVVGVLMEKSIDVIISILGILKAGGVYLPINPIYPQKRINYMINDSNSKLILTIDKFKDKLDDSHKYICMDVDDIYSNNNLIDLDDITTSESMAYVLYTSGSTGNPKGVMVKHRSLNNFIYSLYRDFDNSFDCSDNCLSIVNISFDVSLFEFFIPLFSGGSLVLLSDDYVFEIDKLVEIIVNENISFAYIHPSLLKELSKSLMGHANNLSLDKLSVAVEPIEGKVLEEFLKINKSMKIVNGYGPTEATIYATTYTYISKDSYLKRVPIGKPLSNTYIYILDEDMNLTPVGCKGELYIAGEGVAMGYLNKTELTRERFIDNPFVHGGKMYRTGDIGKWLPNGDIEFIGRVDDQFKIRGFRIELGEILSKLKAMEDVKDATLLVKEQNNTKFICAYIVSDKHLTVRELRKHLSSELPDYMIPSYFVSIDSIPLTPNGKIDKKALPDLNANITTDTKYVSPKTDTETILAQIWEDVLGVKTKVGITDNFFELGGHSLKAMTISSKIEECLDVQIPLAAIMQGKTIENLALFLKKHNNKNALKLEHSKKKPYYPMSSSQKRMYILNNIKDYDIAYNMPIVLKLKGSINIQSLQKTFKKIVERHEVLRTSFYILDGNMVQEIQDNIDFHLEYEKTDIKTHDNITTVIDDFIKPFDLSLAPLFRAKIFTLSENEHILIMDMHHIVSDLVSTNILISDLKKLYRGDSLPKLTYQYKDYCQWEKNFFNTDEYRKQEEYWINKFDENIPHLDLPTDYERPFVQTFEGDYLSYQLEKAVSKNLKDYAKTNSCSLFMVTFAIYNLLLYKYGDNEDIVVGTPINLRKSKELNNIMGFFVNTLAIKNHISSDMTFYQIVEEVKKSILEAYNNQDYPFDKLVEKVGSNGLVNRNPLFDTMFIFENIDMEEIELGSLNIEEFNFENYTSKFDITLTMGELGNIMVLNFEYYTKLFEPKTIEKFAKSYEHIAKTVLNNPHMKLKDISPVDDEERYILINSFNNSYLDFHKTKTIHGLFKEQAKKYPNNIAIKHGNQQITYRELDIKSTQLATLLRSHGVKENTIVPVLMDKSLELIISMLGIMKAGGIYLPISPIYSGDKIIYMLNDSNAHLILTVDKFENTIATSYDYICIDSINIDSDDIPVELKDITTGESIGYAIYTFGTTEKPKGVMIRHNSLTNLVYSLYEDYDNSFDSNDNCLSIANISFDMSLCEFFIPLLSGGKLVLLSDNHGFEVDNLVKTIIDEKITFGYIHPSLLYKVSNSLKENPYKPSLTKLLVGVEPIEAKILEKFLEINKSMKIINGYGTTSTTIFATTYKYLSKDRHLRKLPIGKPLGNTHIYILDKDMNPVPIGCKGEIYVYGIGVAKGYLNNPELTNKKFISNPFIPNEKMYKTGDIGKWLPDGNIEFIGKTDEQVIIKGNRIELGKILNKLRSYKHVKDATLLIKNREHTKFICAYIVPNKSLILSELKEYLSSELPDYMIPSYFINIDSIPIAPNGKTDKKALPEPSDNISIGTEYISPRTDIEKTLVKVWEQVLGLNTKIGIHDNFFELGGHSLKAMNISTKIQDSLGFQVPIATIMQTKTIEKLASYLENSNTDTIFKLKHSESQAYYPISSSQERMYLLSKMKDKDITYNMPIVLKLNNSLNIKSLEVILKKLIETHEGLRTSFHIIEDEIVQKIHTNFDCNLKYKKVYNPSKDNITSIIDNFIQPFELDSTPLFRAKLLTLSENEHILIMDMHHIISDNISINILINDFKELYKGSSLSNLEFHYKDYCQWEKDFFHTKEYRKQEAYWINRFNEPVSHLELPMDYTRPLIQTFEGDYLNYELGKDTSKKLKNYAKNNSYSLFMVTFAIYNILLHKYSNSEDIIVGTPINQRKNGELNNIIGIFINTLALKNHISSDMTFHDLVEQVQECMLQAYENQDYPFNKLVENIDANKLSNRHPLFDTMFTFENKVTEELELDGLKIDELDFGNRTSKFDITLKMNEHKNNMILNFEYYTKIFNHETIKKFAKSYEDITKLVMTNPYIKIKDISILNECDKNKIINDFNNTHMDYPSTKTIDELFKEQVQKHPNKIAVKHENNTITYTDLDAKSNQLAILLRNSGVKENTIVGVLMEKSIDVIISILAILKSGGIYLPITPIYPQKRIDYMLDDSDAQLVLTVEKFRNKIDNSYDYICVDNDTAYSNTKSIELDNITTPNSVAYTIYTSGSTGNPKGVMIKHKSLVNFVYSLYKDYGDSFDSTDSCLSIVNISFDVSICEFFIPLLSGGKLVLLSDDYVFDINKLVETIMNEHISFGYIHPSLLEQVSETLKDYKHNLSFNKLLVGVEPIEGKVLEEFLKLNESMKIINGYGPTETTICATTYRYMSKDRHLPKVPIGKPLGNTNIYILDKNLKPVPIGCKGELYVCGVGVAKGYLNNQDLTNEKFIDSPFISGEKIYKTGDLAKWLPDGNLEFIGRVDDQFKIRGFRIELGEILSKLRSYKYIEDATLTVKENDNIKFICAYIVSNKNLTISELREYLSFELPDYMIPSYFINIDSIPITPNGKVDKKALPKPSENIVTDTEYVPATTDTEKLLVNIWQDILEIDTDIGTEDDFFDLGGHSLLTNLLSVKINEYFNRKVSLQEILSNKTISSLSKLISDIKKDKHSSRYENLILLRKGTTDKNIFFIHAGNGEISNYIGLANKVKKDFNCWGIKAPRNNGFISSDITVYDIAKEYITLIKSVQPKEPYNICGWCIGGTIALEMVYQLEKMNEGINFLGIIDSMPPLKYNEVPSVYFDLESLARETTRIFEYFNINTETDLQAIDSVEQLWKLIANKLEDKSIDLKITEGLIDGSILEIIPTASSLNGRDLVHYVSLISTLNNARFDYKPKGVISTEINYFKAINFYGLPDENIWSTHSTNDMNILEVRGDHFSIFDNPYVEDLSRKINESINSNY